VYSNVLTNIQTDQTFDNDWPPLQPVGLGTNGGGTVTSGVPFIPLGGTPIFDSTKMVNLIKFYFKHLI
jgi:hypothetical protein